MTLLIMQFSLASDRDYLRIPETSSAAKDTRKDRFEAHWR
jgi:hypothetical protein